MSWSPSCWSSSARRRCIELTTVIGFANLTTRSNVALGIESEGFAASCGLEPMASSQSCDAERRRHDDQPSSTTSSSSTEACSSPSPTRCSAPLPTPKTSCRRSWLRWSGVDQTQVRDPRAYLVRIVTRQALNRIRTLSRRREDYVGQWLPEPLLTSPDVAEDVELAESVSIAMLTRARDARSDRAGGVRAARGVRHAVRRDRRGRRQDAGRRAPDRSPGAGARRGSTATDGGEPRRAAAGAGDRSSPP